MNERDLILMQNARFYEAFETADLEVMESLWAHAPYVRCVHPGWAPLSGWEAIRDSWKAIFANGRSMRFSLRNVSVEIHGKLAVVVLIEEITTSGGGMTETVSVVATNIFESDGSEWAMVHHHGSPLMVQQETPDVHYN
jgi:ketosteroid isomerase-like protein